MGKLICVWGSPNSGKTTFSVKLARSIYDEYESKVVVVNADLDTPTLPVLFPNKKADEMKSVGAVLTKTEITQESVIENLVSIKSKANICFLGFKDAENIYTYPRFDPIKVMSMFEVLRSLVDYVVVDCSSTLKNVISRTAIKTASEVLRLASPDLKSISWYSSQLPLFGDPDLRLSEHIQGLNVSDEELFMPIEDTRSHFTDVRFTIPYSKEVKQQMLDGNLFEKVGDKRFNDRFKAITEKVV